MVQSKALALASESPAAPPDVGDVTEPSHAQPNAPTIGDWWRHPSPGPSFDGGSSKRHCVAFEQMLCRRGKDAPEDNPFLSAVRDITMTRRHADDAADPDQGRAVSERPAAG
jgi:hypothetical protein